MSKETEMIPIWIKFLMVGIALILIANFATDPIQTLGALMMGFAAGAWK